jgi:hypothetical protein
MFVCHVFQILLHVLTPVTTEEALVYPQTFEVLLLRKSHDSEIVLSISLEMTHDNEILLSIRGFVTDYEINAIRKPKIN